MRRVDFAQAGLNRLQFQACPRRTMRAAFRLIDTNGDGTFTASQVTCGSALDPWGATCAIAAGRPRSVHGSTSLGAAAVLLALAIRGIVRNTRSHVVPSHAGADVCLVCAWHVVGIALRNRLPARL